MLKVNGLLHCVFLFAAGHRIGKGEGFTDLEYALLRKLQIIEPETVIVTVVHDLQVKYMCKPTFMIRKCILLCSTIVSEAYVRFRFFQVKLLERG